MTNAEAIFDLEQFSFSPIGDGDLRRESVELVLSALREQAEIVRCGECKYGQPSKSAFEGDGITPLIGCAYMTEPNRKREFCSWGKRRESEVSE